MVSLDVLGNNVQRAWALWRLGTRAVFFFKSQSLNRKSNSYAFLSFLFLYKERTKGTGETNWPLWFTKHQFNKKDLTLKR